MKADLDAAYAKARADFPGINVILAGEPEWIEQFARAMFGAGYTAGMVAGSAEIDDAVRGAVEVGRYLAQKSV